MIWSDRNKELYLSCWMFQMISTAFPPERDIWREFGSNATVMRVSGRGRGMGRIPFSLRSCAISLSFFYFFLSSLLLSIFFWGYLLSHLLFFFFFIMVQLLSCSYLAAHQWTKSQHFISLCSVHDLFFLPFIYKILPFFESTVKSNHKSSVWIERLPEKINLSSWSHHRIWRV